MSRAFLDTLFAQELFESTDGSLPGWIAQVAQGTMREYLSRCPPKAMAVVSSLTQQILDHTLPLEQFVKSATLRREYKGAPPPHAEVVKLKENRKKGSGDPPGARVRFFVREKTKEEMGRKKADDKVTLRAEDPEYAAEHGIRADAVYYADALRKATE